MNTALVTTCFTSLLDICVVQTIQVLHVIKGRNHLDRSSTCCVYHTFI